MPETAFLFPGQGAQSVGMGQTLHAEFAECKQIFTQANEILGYDLARICFEGPKEQLDTTKISQPAIFVTSWAALKRMEAEKPELLQSCSAAAGLSLGEYTALAFAGCFSFEAGLKLVQLRGEAMQQAADATPSGMASIIGLERHEVEEICEQAAAQGRVGLANLLGPGNTVISGENRALEEAGKRAEARRARVVRLTVAGAFHSEIMKPADEKLQAALSEITVGEPRIPVVSNVDAKPHDGTGEIGAKLVRQVISPVLWEDSIRSLLSQGFDSFTEVGPGKVLRGLLRRIDRKAPCENFGS